jgi:hypothetical protein
MLMKNFLVRFGTILEAHSRGDLEINLSLNLLNDADYKGENRQIFVFNSIGKCLV